MTIPRYVREAAKDTGTSGMQKTWWHEFLSKYNGRYIALPKTIEVMYIYCAISRYIDYCDRPNHHYDTHFTALVLAFVHTELVLGLNPAMLLGPQPGIDPRINPGTCLRSHRRHSGNFPGPCAVWKGLQCILKNILELYLSILNKINLKYTTFW